MATKNEQLLFLGLGLVGLGLLLTEKKEQKKTETTDWKGIIMSSAELGNKNLAMIALTDKLVQPKLKAVVSDLKGHGWKNVEIVSTERSKQEQEALIRSGAGVKGSFHIKRPEWTGARAADFGANRYGKDKKKFLLMLASSALAHGFESGIFYGLTEMQKTNLMNAIKRKDWNYKGDIGNDPNHIQFRVS